MKKCPYCTRGNNLIHSQNAIEKGASMKQVIVIFLVFILSACGPSSEQIQAAIEKTRVAAAAATASVPTATATVTKQPTRTIAPTSTPSPIPSQTNEPVIVPTATDAAGIEENRSKIKEAVSLIAESSSDIQSVDMVRFVDGTFEIEAKTKWASRDRQADVSYELIKLFAYAYCRYDEKTITEKLGADTFAIKLVTYSTNGDYRYESFSNYALLYQVYEKTISHEEWIKAAGADFKNAQ
jgi:hypothetical protein